MTWIVDLHASVVTAIHTTNNLVKGVCQLVTSSATVPNPIFPFLIDWINEVVVPSKHLTDEKRIGRVC